MARTTASPAVSLPPPAPLASVLRAAGFHGTLSVQKADGSPLSSKDRQALARALRAFTAAETVELTGGEISRAVARVIEAKTASGSKTKRAAAPAKHKAARTARPSR